MVHGQWLFKIIKGYKPEKKVQITTNNLINCYYLCSLTEKNAFFLSEISTLIDFEGKKTNLYLNFLQWLFIGLFTDEK